MTAPEHLLTLAERVEASEGADRRLDVEVAVAVDWRWEDWEDGENTAVGQAEKHGLDWLVHRATEGLSSLWRGIPRYTESLDAAMSLVPEGWSWQSSYRVGWRTQSAEVFNPRIYESTVVAVAATPALALVAASLRARAALSKDMGR